jgi:xylulokinase
MEKERMTGEDAYGQLDGIAETAPIGSGSLVFMPHMMVGERAPYWDEHIRGGFIGLTTYHTRAHMFRAVLEGVAYAMRYSIEAAYETGIEINRATLVDGGARSRLWRQIIADVTGVEMSYIPDAQGAPLGDAMLAGLGTGVIPNHKVIEEWIGEKVAMRPDPESSEKYRRYYELYRQCLEATEPVYRSMSE